MTDETDKTMEKDAHITKDMIIADVINRYPYIAMYIMDYGVHCINCGVAAFETLEEGFAVHGMGEEEIDQVISELNKVIDENEKV